MQPRRLGYGDGVKLSSNPLPEAPVPRRWSAALELTFADAGGRTRLSQLRHQGPLRVQRLFHPDPDGTAHCYLLHPPGGVAAGDELFVDVAVESGSALLTTPSAGRFYRVGHYLEPQLQRVTLRCAENARLAWLPQETLLFSGANARLETVIELDKGAAFAFWDIVALGRPASGERFELGRCDQDIQLYRGGRLELSERLRLSAGDRLARSPLGLHGASTTGLCILLGEYAGARQRQWLTRVNGSAGYGPFSVTQRGDFVVARYLGEDAGQCRLGFAALWQQVVTMQGSRPSLPRIWHT
jgi:urease accessory protein